MSDNSQPVQEAERIPPPGTMAYAQWKRRQELMGEKPENQKTGKPGNQPASFPASQEASQPTGKKAGKPSSQPISQPGKDEADGAIASILGKRLKPLTDEEPIRKVTFLITPDEEEILEELKFQLRRRYRLKATKTDIVRGAIRLIAQDFAKNQQTSFLARKLGGK